MGIKLYFLPDASGLSEAERVRESQELVLGSLQEYTESHHPGMPSKFGELLLRMPELQRVCQVIPVSLSQGIPRYTSVSSGW